MRLISSILIFSIFIIILHSCKTLDNKQNRFNTNFVYVSRDTLYSLDKEYKNDITINLIKLNKDKTVQVSKNFSYREGEYSLNNSNVTDLLDEHTSYYFVVKGTSKIEIKCFFKYPNRVWYDFATANSNRVTEKFIIKGDTLIRVRKWSDHFDKIYILDKSLRNNHKEINYR